MNKIYHIYYILKHLRFRFVDITCSCFAFVDFIRINIRFYETSNRSILFIRTPVDYHLNTKINNVPANLSVTSALNRYILNIN